MSELTDTLEGKISSSAMIPPIAIRAAKRIKELEEAISLIRMTDDTCSHDPIGLIHNICDEVI